MTGWDERDVDHLRRLRQERDTLDARIDKTVSDLRQQEAPWSVIGAALGVSKQAAQHKYRSRRVSLSDRPLQP